jgi:hypothetical protein
MGSGQFDIGMNYDNDLLDPSLCGGRNYSTYETDILREYSKNEEDISSKYPENEEFFKNNIIELPLKEVRKYNIILREQTLNSLPLEKIISLIKEGFLVIDIQEVK